MSRDSDDADADVDLMRIFDFDRVYSIHDRLSTQNQCWTEPDVDRVSRPITKNIDGPSITVVWTMLVFDIDDLHTHISITLSIDRSIYLSITLSIRTETCFQDLSLCVCVRMRMCIRTHRTGPSYSFSKVTRVDMCFHRGFQRLYRRSKMGIVRRFYMYRPA